MKNVNLTLDLCGLVYLKKPQKYNIMCDYYYVEIIKFNNRTDYECL